MKMQDYMWENKFLPVFEKLNTTRQKENVAALKDLIQEMHLAGYAAAAIGRYIGKDHTTILYHLGKAGLATNYFKSAEDQKLADDMKKERLANILQKKKDDNRAREERHELKEQLIKERLMEKALKSRKYWERRKGAEKMRAKVFAMYEKGHTYHQIKLALLITEHRIQDLLIHHPMYRKIRPIRHTAINTRRPVIQYDKDGNTVAEYESGRAAARALGIPSVGICLTANGKIESAGGFMWAFKDDSYHEAK